MNTFHFTLVILEKISGKRILLLRFFHVELFPIRIFQHILYPSVRNRIRSYQIFIVHIGLKDEQKTIIKK